MTSRCLRDEVMGLTARLADECHPQVVLQHAEALARYARLTSACDALESFLGKRPPACIWRYRSFPVARTSSRSGC